MNTHLTPLTSASPDRPQVVPLRPRGLGWLWSVGAALALLWTGLAALAASIMSWVGDWLRLSGTGVVPPLPDVPAWLSDWVSTDAWATAAQDLQALVQSAVGWLPALGAVTGWLEILVWVVWGAGLALLLLIVGGLHAWLVREARIAPRRR